MNAKKCKAERKFLRLCGIDPREDKYTAYEPSRKVRTGPKGAYQVVSYRLTPRCGRASYKLMKRATP